jgi:hypothetical protein
MFPEDFVRRYLLAWSRPNDLVLDPFCGRGTTIFESLLNSRTAIGCDINPVAVCVSRAKSDPPAVDPTLERIEELRDKFAATTSILPKLPEFFSHCYHESTLRQVLFLRSILDWRNRREDCFIAAAALGCLHGESHRTELCFSNRMPRTISTKPGYSVRWWTERGYLPPERDVFDILRKAVQYRFESPPPELAGFVVQGDARDAKKLFPQHVGKVKLVITSPPYLDVTNYREDQWLRVWFLGGPDSPKGDLAKDDRHRRTNAYWDFLREAWRGVLPLLHRKCQVVVRIGGSRLPPEQLSAGLLACLKQTGREVHLAEVRTTSIGEGQQRSFQGRPRRRESGVEFDFRFRLGVQAAAAQRTRSARTLTATSKAVARGNLHHGA